MSKPKSQKKKKNLGGIIVFAAEVVAGGCVGFFGADMIANMPGGEDRFFLNLLVLLAGLYLALFLQIIVHEGGHLVFGLLTGYKFVSFNILGIIWQKDDNGHIRVGRMTIAGAGGQCLMAPPAYNGGDFPFTLYNLGGALANLIFSGLCALLCVVISIDWLRILLLGEVFVGVMLALTNGLPLPVAAIQNDGKNLLCIRKDEHARRAFWVQMTAAAEQSRGVRLTDMPEEWFAAFPDEAMNNPIVSAIAVMNVSRLMNQLDFPAAAQEIHALLAREKGILGLYRTFLTCDGAVCELIAGAPGELADSLAEKEHQQIIKAMKKNPSILRTQYALALLKEQDTAKAEKLLTAFEAAAKSYPYPQEIDSERDILRAIQSATATGGSHAP